MCRNIKRRLGAKGDDKVMSQIHEVNPYRHPSKLIMNLLGIIYAVSGGKKNIDISHFHKHETNGSIIHDRDSKPIPYRIDTVRVIKMWVDYNAHIVSGEHACVYPANVLGRSCNNGCDGLMKYDYDNCREDALDPLYFGVLAASSVSMLTTMEIIAEKLSTASNPAYRRMQAPSAAYGLQGTVCLAWTLPCNRRPLRVTQTDGNDRSPRT